MPSKALENQRDRLAVALARGASVRRASGEAGVPESTARRWASDPEFKDVVKSLREELVSQAVGVYARLLPAAVYALGRLLNSKDHDVRLRAARAIASDFVAMAEHADLAARLEGLEARFRVANAKRRKTG
jgi:hypothetical protein